MPMVETIRIERTSSRTGKPLGSFLIEVWQSGPGWHWHPTTGKAAPSVAYPTREAAIGAARLRDGLDPNV